VKGTWTYIEEPRYYGAITVMIHIGIFVLYNYFKNKKKILESRVFLFLILLLLPEATRGLLFGINRMNHFSREEYMWQVDEKHEKVIQKLLEDKHLNPGNQKLAVTASSNWLTWKTALFSMQPAFKDFNKVNHPDSIHTSQPAVLFFVVDTNHANRFRPFINMNSENLIGSFQRWKYYSVPILPD
jgi:hypothetical protein